METLFPFVALDYQCPFPSRLVPFWQRGNKWMGRKWRDNEEIMWKKQHLIPISYWGGGGEEGWRGKLKLLLVKSWSDRVSEKLTVTEEKNAAEGWTFRGGGVNQNVHWGRGSAVAEGNISVLGEQLKKTDSCCTKQGTLIQWWRRKRVHVHMHCVHLHHVSSTN